MTRNEKQRLDQILVARGLAESREKAQRMIRAGQVRRGTDVMDKPGAKLPDDIALEVRELRDRFVSRGGWKLQAALDSWSSLTPCPPVCADIGASTGGFTDCLLQHGARRVYAIDVGATQLAPSMREDPRVVLLDQTNARHLTARSLPEPIDLAVADVSFISLRLILGPIAEILRDGTGRAVVLVKPQFEAGRERVGKGGVVRDPDVHREILEKTIFEYAPAAGLEPRGLIPSPLKGPKGNREYLLRLNLRDSAQEAEVPEPVLDESHIRDAVREAFAAK